MSHFHLEHLNREAYINSISHIQDKRSFGFAQMAMHWWDRHFSWKTQGCIVLTNESHEHLSYIFYKIDRYHEYLTIHNIFTPFKLRRQGYAYELFDLVFQIAVHQNVSRFRMVCVPQSLDFYLSLGMVYWGVNSVGDYYCDLPLPKGGITEVKSMTNQVDTQILAGKHLDDIASKVKGNSEKLNQEQTKLHQACTKKLNTSYLYDELMEIDHQ